MQQTNTFVVGASLSGLALAASLQKHGIEYVLIEREAQTASPWHHHYQRLHLHTYKRISHLPYKKFDSSVPRYPSRQEVIDYVDGYQKQFGITPLLNTEAVSIKKEKDSWITETSNGTFQSKYAIMATGAFGHPKPFYCKGMETFSGTILHSSEYKTGKGFAAQNVLVVGFGNSACEIAIDLYEQNAFPCMSVRSPVNIIPRDLAGIPILQLSLLLHHLPPRVADALIAPVMRLRFGDYAKLGLRKKAYGAFEAIQKERQIPVLDIGTVGHIRKGHVAVYGEIDYIDGKTVCFKDGKKQDFDVIIACIGFTNGAADIVKVPASRFEDLRMPLTKQKYFGADGLYFCGFWVGSTGHIREIASDAQKIAKDITRKEKSATLHTP